MEIRNFIYHGTEREVVITEETADYISGWDLSKLTESEAREAARELVKDYDMKNYTEEKSKFKNLSFRRFKKSSIETGKKQ